MEAYKFTYIINRTCNMGFNVCLYSKRQLSLPLFLLIFCYASLNTVFVCTRKFYIDVRHLSDDVGEWIKEKRS